MNSSSKGLLDLIRQGSVEQVKAAIVNNSSMIVNKPEREGADLPLIVASSLGKSGIVQVLLEEGKADVLSAKEQNTKVTPLMYASLQGNLGMSKVLVDFARKQAANNVDLLKKQLIDAQSFQGMSALIFAVNKGHFDVAEFLVKDVIADTNLKAYDGSTALMAAAQHNNESLTELLLDFGQADANIATTAEGITALMLTGSVPVAKLLIEKGKANVDFQAVKGATAISSACNKGLLDLVKYLIEEKGANATLKSPFDNSDSLTCAVLSGNAEVVKYLLFEGPFAGNPKIHVNDPLTNGITLLMLSPNVSISRLLLDLGADVNQSAMVDNSTALMAAAIKGNPDITGLLLERGARASILNTAGQNALSLSFIYGRNAKTFNLLLAKWKNEQKLERPANTFFSSLKLEIECSFLTIVAAILRLFPAPKLSQ